MSSRPLRLAGGLVLSTLAFGLAPVAPALADGMITPPARHHVQHVRHHAWHARPRVIERVRVVTRTVPVEHVRVVNRYVPVDRVVNHYVDRPVPVYVQQPVYYASGCGHCGSHVNYAPAVTYAPPVHYNYSSGCGGCGYGVAATGTYYNSEGYVGAGVYGPSYTAGYFGTGYLRGGLGVSRRVVANEVGFRRGYYGRRTFVGRRAYR